MDQYVSRAQKGIGNNTRGAKHQLMVDGAVTQDCKTRSTNLCTAWIDYKKACDSMPHTWILECLDLYKIDGTLGAFIKNSMALWKTTLEANSQPIAENWKKLQDSLVRQSLAQVLRQLLVGLQKTALREIQIKEKKTPSPITGVRDFIQDPDRRNPDLAERSQTPLTGVRDFIQDLDRRNPDLAERSRPPLTGVRVVIPDLDRRNPDLAERSRPPLTGVRVVIPDLDRRNPDLAERSRPPLTGVRVVIPDLDGRNPDLAERSRPPLTGVRVVIPDLDRKSRSSREKSTSSHGSESRHSRSRQELPQTSRTPSEPFPMSTAKFQKCVLKKLVELMQEVKRIGGADPIASAYQLNRMDTLEELDATEERIQQNDERQVLITQLSRVGGKNTRDCTTKIMDRLMTNNLMATLNMKGHGTKRAFKGTKLYQVVIAAVKSWSQKATEHDISHAVADHLKHAPGHSGGGGYKAR
ncbi:uncharacterized protein LOC143324285 [Chaetodon auriga]|uniref:uncharacterized protein LOC143324285 n=1 Tax=Chaetodon auriga TaxID=39042 RepID=UPI00403291F3